jgi:hypothetical protein
MAETTRTRVRRRLRRRTSAPGQTPPRPPGWARSPDYPPSAPEDPDGGAGVREPRRPRPSPSGDALSLEEPSDQRLDLVG